MSRVQNQSLVNIIWYWLLILNIECNIECKLSLVSISKFFDNWIM